MDFLEKKQWAKNILGKYQCKKSWIEIQPKNIIFKRKNLEEKRNILEKQQCTNNMSYKQCKKKRLDNDKAKEYYSEKEKL